LRDGLAGLLLSIRTQGDFDAAAEMAGGPAEPERRLAVEHA
jgi:hypothetical protein